MTATMDADVTDNTNAPYILDGAHTRRIIQLIDAAHAGGVTPILWGKPGVGKTALVEALSAREGFGGLVRVLTGSQDRSDTLGMPSRDLYMGRDGQQYNVTGHATPDWVVKANDAEGTFYVFLDEFPQADTEVQGTFLTVLQNYVMPSGVKIKPHVKFIAAGNPTDVVSSGYELIEPLQNRLSHLTYEPPREEWFRGMIDAWGVDVSEDEKAMRNFVVGYLVANGDKLHEPPPVGSTENAWPSRRSWDNLARMAASLTGGRLMSNTLTEDDKALVEAAAVSLVGESAGMDFATACFRIVIKSPTEIVADPSCIDWSNPFVGFVALSSVVSWLTDPSDLIPVVNVFNAAISKGPKDIPTVWVKQLAAKVTAIGGSQREFITTLNLNDADFKAYTKLAFS